VYVNVALAPGRGVLVVVGVKVGSRVNVGGSVAVGPVVGLVVQVPAGPGVAWAGAMIKKMMPRQ
jgi:hypothetical protein